MFLVAVPIWMAYIVSIRYTGMTDMLTTKKTKPIAFCFFWAESSRSASALAT